MTVLQWGSPLTVADLAHMAADGRRYELVDGSLLETPAEHPPARAGPRRAVVHRTRR